MFTVFSLMKRVPPQVDRIGPKVTAKDIAVAPGWHRNVSCLFTSGTMPLEDPSSMPKEVTFVGMVEAL
jgi:hypothetical protein